MAILADLDQDRILAVDAATGAPFLDIGLPLDTVFSVAISPSHLFWSTVDGVFSIARSGGDVVTMDTTPCTLVRADTAALYCWRSTQPLVRYDVAQGSQAVIANVDPSFQLHDDQILFGSGNALMAVPKLGGEIVTIATFSDPLSYQSYLVPFGKFVVVSRYYTSWDRVVKVDLDTGAQTTLQTGYLASAVDSNGRLLLVDDDGAYHIGDIDAASMSPLEVPAAFPSFGAMDDQVIVIRQPHRVIGISRTP